MPPALLDGRRPMVDMPLPQAAIAALQRGDTLAAIRIVRDATGLDLKRAAEAVERHGRPQRIGSMPAAAGAGDGRQVAQQVMEALLGGKKADAFKLLREHGGSDLQPALQTIERLFGPARGDAVSRQEHRSEHRLDAERARDSARLQVLIHEKRVPTVSPGDKPGGGLVWVLVALAAALLWLVLASAGG